jgi:hypothetical protein
MAEKNLAAQALCPGHQAKMYSRGFQEAIRGHRIDIPHFE